MGEGIQSAASSQATSGAKSFLETAGERKCSPGRLGPVIRITTARDTGGPPAGLPCIRFVLHGPPRTKKNHNRLVRAGRRYRVLPSAAHERWYRDACSQAWAIREELRRAGVDLPIREPVRVWATFWRDRQIGDECGYMQALGDWLERVGIIVNDRLIHWGEVRLEKDAENPRIEVEIEIHNDE